jgi:anti-sigma regulatory factor (Ser/Thr protein kinase)/methyl-accepting chemotaxis protein
VTVGVGAPILRPTIGLKLGVLVGALVAVLVVSSILLVDQTRTTGREYDQILQTQVRQGLLARQLQVELKKEVQEWKDVLLRGSNPDDLEIYTANLRAEESAVASIYGQLLNSDPDPTLRSQLQTFQKLYQPVNSGYEKALPAFITSEGKDYRTADRSVRGLDRPATDLVDQMVSGLESRIAQQVSHQRAATQARQRTTLIAAAGLLIALIAALALALMRIVRPIRRLIQEAFRAASERLPGAISTIRSMDVGAEPPVLPPFTVAGHDELRDLGEALTSMQSSALTLAVEQHRADRETSDMLINLGRRNQNLLGRMLSYVTELERKEQNPETLSQLFQLDHAATRIRRNAESMLVLAGATQTRTWSRPVPAIDVVRAALSEIEEYVRVDLHHIEDGLVAGVAVADVVHLVAELVENATHFSPPSTQVTVIGQRIRDGYRLRVIDQGVGMTRRELDDANRRITDTESGWADAKLLGLHVVGRLARRRDIAVALEPSAGRGITASVLLPTSLLADGADPREPVPALTAAAEQEAPAVATPAGAPSLEWSGTPSAGLPAPDALTGPATPATGGFGWADDPFAVGAPGPTSAPVPVVPTRQNGAPSLPELPAPAVPVAGRVVPGSAGSGALPSRAGDPGAGRMIDLTASDPSPGWAISSPAPAARRHSPAPSGPLFPPPGGGQPPGRAAQEPSPVPVRQGTAPAGAARGPSGPGAPIPKRVRGAQLPDLGPTPDPVIHQMPERTVEPESLRWQLRSFQLDVEAARRALTEPGGGRQRGPQDASAQNDPTDRHPEGK